MSSLNASNAATSSSLRPRNRRLISGLDDEEPAQAELSGNLLRSSPFASPLNSRSASPIPRAGLTRVPSSQPRSTPRSTSTNRVVSQGGSSDALSSISGFWGNSWSSIQGIASNVLGSNGDSPNGVKPKDFKQSKRVSGSVPQPKWGISSAQAQDIGTGTKEERESMVRAMKRKDLLNANGHIYQDTVGKFKRRNSDERVSSSAPPAEGEERDALVYIHHVQPSDTLAGLTIKYNCQAALLRKANRMWPSDSVQIRKRIFLPVDACGVKGRRCSGPGEQGKDLLRDDTQDTTEMDANGWPTGGHSTTRPRTNTNTSNPPASVASTKSEPEPQWTHDSWVMLPHDSKPIEIGRMPRRTLGFFPPARRKSITFSDSNSPSVSLDLPRSVTATTSAASPQRSHNDDASITSSPPSIRHPRTRSRKDSTSKAFAFQGIGGVGTLGRNVRVPGPGDDPLNNFITTHFPHLQPAPGQEHFTPWMPGMFDTDGENSHPNNFATAAAARNGGFDLEQVGGAIETWMRKTAAKVSASLNEHANTAGSRQFPPVPGLGEGAAGLGDLIELQGDAFAIGDGADDDHHDDGGGRGRLLPSAGPGVASSSASSSARMEVPASMRGREGRGGTGKGKKSD